MSRVTHLIPFFFLAGCEELPLQSLLGASTGECSSDVGSVEDVVASDAKAGGLSIAAGDVSSVRMPDGRIVATAPTREGGQVVYLSESTRAIPAGTYQIVKTYAGIEFKGLSYASNVITIAGDGDASQTTPLGDEMCAGAPEELWDFCQDFVACAAHDLFC